ncbi:MAG: putative oxidoreductase [Acidimicrobiaceae bacterium]|nr:putative oxidoreductase [Acidimicrobiaceae bacterium]
MTRSFSPEPVAPELLEELLSAAGRAPSAGFTQGVDLVAITTGEARVHFWELATDEAWRSGGARASGLMAAPAIVVPVADPGAYVRRYAEQDKGASSLSGRVASEWPVPYWIVDASFMVMQLLLAATDAGLGALFFRLHAEAGVVLEGLGAPAGRVAIGAVAIGRPAGDDARTSPATRKRRGLDDLVHLQRW